jgi:hypothetical protein
MQVNDRRQFAKVVKVGDRVKHWNVHQWGRVLEVHSQHDETVELVVQREINSQHDRPGLGYWASYHIGEHDPLSESVCPWTTVNDQGSAVVCGEPALYTCDQSLANTCVAHASSCCRLKATDN